MEEFSQFPWIKNYPEHVPATIDPDVWDSLPDFQEKMSKEYGDAPAFTNFGSTLTYAELEEKSSQMAA